MIVRRAGPDDAQGLTELGEAVGSEPEGWLVTTNGWRNVSDERRYLRAIRRYPNAAVFVAADGDLIVGRLSIARDQHPASRHVADLGIMVAASHRRQGVGTALLQAAVEWARKADVQKLELHVFPHNTGASSSTRSSVSCRRATGARTTGAATEFTDAILMAYML